jgi:hypothetical protein
MTGQIDRFDLNVGDLDPFGIFVFVQLCTHLESGVRLVRREDVDALLDQIAGTVLTHLSSMPARCAPRGDLAIRRAIERVVFEVRSEISEACSKMADKCGEPPLSEQG